MSIKNTFIFQSFAQAQAQLAHFEQQLKEHVETDWAVVKKDLEDAVAHWRAEFARLEALVPARVLAHINEGVPARVAVDMADVPTKAENAATEAAKVS